jgi:1-acyl-sn-glycerol-3-phosphate acyltransferase
MLLILDNPAVVLKQELADLPMWGKAAQAFGVIPVDREGSATALRRMLRAARAAMAAARPILIFPEGTRVPPGAHPPLRAGFAGLYGQLKLPVVPVALDSGRLWGRRAFVKKPGIVTFRFCDTIPAGLPRDEAEARVHQAINALD